MKNVREYGESLIEWMEEKESEITRNQRFAEGPFPRYTAIPKEMYVPNTIVGGD
ncbi:hypothetical protein HYT25_02575 [Candidatus Pacearchaeota archaeon]|nr:hypothetical protein [Candidatus Pacearchaeota archaeon]